MNAVLSLRLTSDERNVDFDIPLDPIQVKRLTGNHGFRRDEELDHLLRLAFARLDIALRTQPASEGAGSARDQ